MVEEADRQLIFGTPAEWKDFEGRHLLFFERYPHLKQALHTAFIRSGTTADPIDRFVFFYGRLCAEDFFEVLLCCGNGRGVAALKLLRTFYEQAVTLRHLHEHPDTLDSFWDFHNVQEHRLFVAIEDTFGAGTVSEKVAADVKARYEAVKEDFKVACKVCGTDRPGHHWTKLDFVSMAKKSGNLGELIVPAYYVPMKHAHATAGAMYSRLEHLSDGGLTFNSSPQRESADKAFIAAHQIILHVLGVQAERFKVPSLAEQLDVCTQDFIDIHRKVEAA